MKLLQRFELLLRPTLDLEPDVFERAWLTAELAILQATVRPPLSAPFIERAPADVARVRAMILGTGTPGYIACAGAVRDMAQTTMLLRLHKPTLVMTGRQDPACTVDQSIVLHRMIEGSQMRVLEDAAHLSNIEQPAAFNAALREFIDAVDDRLAA